MIDCLVLLPRIINWIFFELGFIEFTLNHFNIFCISYFRSFKAVCRLIMQLYIASSTGKLHIFAFSVKRKGSLINKLKNNGPKIEPCRTLLAISYESL